MNHYHAKTCSSGMDDVMGCGNRMALFESSLYHEKHSMNQPVYKHIQSHILAAIEQGEWPAGTQIPTEMDLAAQFSVSRMTVNKAITALSAQKILTRVAGRGTFVADRKVELPLMQIVDFADEIRLRGQKHHVRVLRHDWQDVFDEQALMLGMANGARAGYAEVLHFENDAPLILEQRYVNPVHVPEFMQQDFGRITPTAYLLGHFPLTEIEHTVEAVAASEHSAALLQLAHGAPCLQVSRRTWCEDVLISYARFVAAGSRYKLRSRYHTG